MNQKENEHDYYKSLFERIQTKAEDYIETQNIDRSSVAVFQEFNKYEVKAAGDDEERKGVWLKGYLSTFGNIDRHRDRINTDAFDDTIKDIKKIGKLIMLRDHVNSTDFTAGSFPAKKIKVDDTGLYAEGFVSLTEKTAHTVQMIMDRHLDTFSIGGLFLYDTDVKMDRDKKPIFTILKIILLEASIVSIPANPKATFQMKNFFSSSKRISVGSMNESELEARSKLFAMSIA